jgi:hypothetical protein
MKHRLHLIFLGLIMLTLSACEQTTSNNADNKTTSVSDFKTVEWIELMPEDDLEALLNPPSYVTDIEEGVFEDQISHQLQNTLHPDKDDSYQQALRSTRIIPTMDGQSIRIPGFIVPLEFDHKKNVTEFFLVPFFGACIHIPPPPPNQIIFVKAPQGLKQDELYYPYWITGRLSTTLIENEMATAAYSMDMQGYEIYIEE